MKSIALLALVPTRGVQTCTMESGQGINVK